mmetsp:Transcript_19942/g.37570  ORF Transcript_19942/g.37570 Transcript_19942/m.37570 type:complete len:203 (-) Transcript_19942:469-1077(-)
MLAAGAAPIPVGKEPERFIVEPLAFSVLSWLLLFPTLSAVLLLAPGAEDERTLAGELPSGGSTCGGRAQPDLNVSAETAGDSARATCTTCPSWPSAFLPCRCIAERSSLWALAESTVEHVDPADSSSLKSAVSFIGDPPVICRAFSKSCSQRLAEAWLSARSLQARNPKSSSNSREYPSGTLTLRTRRRSNERFTGPPHCEW